MKNKLYDILKWVAITVLPAVNAFWVTVANAWGLNYVEPVSITIAALNALLGLLVGVSAVNYAKKNK